MRVHTIVSGLCAWGAACLACGDEPASLSRDVAAAIPEVATTLRGDVIAIRDADFIAGDPPVLSSDEALPAIVSLSGPPTVTNGGTALVHVQLSPPVAAPTFVVQLAGQAGYHSVAGVDPEGDGSYDISVQVSGDAEQTSLVLRVALLDASGVAGPSTELEIPLLHSGTGDVKVTLSFDRVHDLDLHVLEPTGDEIYYQKPSSVTGGRLDLDSGAHCAPNSSNSENVFWPSGGAPAGEYSVSVQNYEQCSPGAVSFTITVAHDQVVETYRGSFPDGTAGEAVTANNVLDVATFRLEP